MTPQDPAETASDPLEGAVDPQPAPGKAGLKLLLELGPLALFFYLTRGPGIVVATQAFLAATLVAFPVAWWLERRVPVMSLVTAAMVGLFGGLTIWLEDATFIKLKPTVASLFLAGVLAGGQLRGKRVLRSLLGSTLRMDDEGWRLLTWRWVGLFTAVAAANEVVWRTQSDEVWAGFKLGLFFVTFVFMMFQLPLMKRHELPGEGGG
jgi:intracellular septation protein